MKNFIFNLILISLTIWLLCWLYHEDKQAFPNEINGLEYSIKCLDGHEYIVTRRNMTPHYVDGKIQYCKE